MPVATIPDETLGLWLTEMLTGVSPASLPWQVMLWSNDYTPDHTTTLADLVECTFSGYARATFSRDAWTTPVVADGRATSYQGLSPIAWPVLAPSTETPYGYAVVDPTTSQLRLVQRFEAADIGDLSTAALVRLLPSITLMSAGVMAAKAKRIGRAPSAPRSV